MNVDELRRQWRGKYVRTERELTREEYSEYMGSWPGWHPGYSWGGEGVVEDFVEQGGKIWLHDDCGMEWQIDDHTDITEVEPYHPSTNRKP